MAVTPKLRFETMKRDNFTCQYCGRTPPDAVLEVDHREPKAKGGKDTLENLVTSCFECNRGKGVRTLVAPTAKNGLVGMWFHIRNPDPNAKKRVRYQGIVLARVEPDMYLIQYASWDDGELDYCKLVREDELRGPLWRFWPMDLLEYANEIASETWD